MHFNRHSQLEGRHSFFSASNHAWTNYDEDKIVRTFLARMEAAKGTRYHALAAELIELGVKVKNPKTLALYVNDAIGYKMTPEQPLYYSDNAFGTCDAISFRRNKLRIHDLKMGVTETSVKQLEVYAAYFCLEYKFRPFDIEMELRIYQNGECRIYDADPDDIFHIMDKIVNGDKLINTLRLEGAL